jgi:hypothetical protein
MAVLKTSFPVLDRESWVSRMKPVFITVIPAQGCIKPT